MFVHRKRWLGEVVLFGSMHGMLDSWSLAPGQWLLVLGSWSLTLGPYGSWSSMHTQCNEGSWQHIIYIWVRWERGQVGISESSSGGAGGNLEIRKSANLEMGKSAYIYPSCRRVGSHFAIGP